MVAVARAADRPGGTPPTHEGEDATPFIVLPNAHGADTAMTSVIGPARSALQSVRHVDEGKGHPDAWAIFARNSVAGIRHAVI
jgi:hypothetical protein